MERLPFNREVGELECDVPVQNGASVVAGKAVGEKYSPQEFCNNLCDIDGGRNNFSIEYFIDKNNKVDYGQFMLKCLECPHFKAFINAKNKELKGE